MVSGCLMSWPNIKRKIVILKCLLLFYATAMNYFLIGLWCAMKSGFFMTTSDDQLSGWTKKMLQSTSQSQTCTQKRSWSLFGGLLCIWPTTAFWILAKPLHLRSMLSKPMRCTENQYLQPALVNIKSPTLLHNNAWPHFTQPMLQKLNQFGYKVLPHMPYSPDFWPTDYHFFKDLNNFLQGQRFHNQQEAENAFQEFVKSWSMNFLLWE